MAFGNAFRALLLCWVISFGLLSCHQEKEKTPPAPTTPSTAQTPSQAPATAPETQPITTLAPIIDPKADRILKQMSDYLKTQGQFSFHAQISQDDVLPTGQLIKLEAVNDIAVRRPDRVISQYRGDSANKNYWYDGRTITLLDLNANVYAQIPVPASIDGAVDYVMQNYGFSPPLSDLLSGDPYMVMTKNLRVALNLGLSEVDEVPCHHLAFVGKYVDWQIWIENGKMWVPRKIVIVYKNLPGNPQFSAVLSDWDFSTPLAEGLFFPSIPPGASPTQFIPLASRK